MTAPVRDLIERLRKASGPDNELDAEIWMTMHPLFRDWPRDDRGYQIGWTTPSDGRAYLSTHYTASIDDALTLVPEGWEWSVNGGPNTVPSAQLSRGGQYQDDQVVEADATSPTIALCIAALEARSAAGRQL